MPKPINIGHRGHARTTENTLKSLHEAIDLGAEMLEMDVQLTSDGVPIVFHDRTLRRMVKKSGAVAARTGKFLTQVDLGQGLRIPSLAEALRELTPRVPINIELKFKDWNYRPLVTAVCEEVTKLGVERKILLSSFHHKAVDIARRVAPAIAAAQLFGRNTGLPHADDFEHLKGLKQEPNDLVFQRPAAVVYHKMIDEELAQAFHRADLTLLTYTVDEPEEMIRMRDLGVHGIITNRPDVLREVLE